MKQSTVTARCNELGIEIKPLGYWARYNIEEVRDYVQKNYPGYEVVDISTEGPTRVHFRCNKGHESVVDTNRFMHSRGQYCRICKVDRQYISQKICQEIAESIFKRKFEQEKTFPWLINDRGNLMRIDMYLGFKKPYPNGIKGLAIEFNGEQHYRHVEFFHKKEEDFLRQKLNDVKERKLCKMNHVLLIDVPYTVEYHNMRNFLIKACNRHGIPTE